MIVLVLAIGVVVLMVMILIILMGMMFSPTLHSCICYLPNWFNGNLPISRHLPSFFPTSDIDECDSDPCLNNATCNDLINGYNCSCAAGFDGILCENGKLFAVTFVMKL